MRQQSFMLIHITGSTFWLLVFLLSLFGFCFIRNHASSLVVNVFFYCFLKKKKVRKLQVNPFPSPVRADHRRSRCGCRYYEVGVLSFRSLFFYLHYYTPLHVHSSPCLLLPVMCLSRVVLVWGSTPGGKEKQRFIWLKDKLPISVRRIRPNSYVFFGMQFSLLFVEPSATGHL